ncbi:MAG: cytochrome P450 [Sphingomonas fennica]
MKPAMSADPAAILASRAVLRPRQGIAAALMDLLLRIAPAGFAFLRRWWPIPRIGTLAAATRHDDVIEVFARDDAFGVPYAAKLDLLMGGEPFVLGMADGPAYRDAIAALRQVIRLEDLPRLAARTERRAGAIVAGAGGRLEVVDGLVRPIAFGVIADYLGIPPPAGGDLAVWATRLFEYQFVAGDAPLVAEVAVIAPTLRAHVDRVIAARRADGGGGADVLGRCLAAQAAGDARFADAAIRTMLLGMMVGGPPQPPMVVPQALEQLLRRPAALAAAQAAARAGDDETLRAHVLEAMRFDPLGPALPRIARHDTVLAAGTERARAIPAGTKVFACFQSAMLDPRRVAEPARFVAGRPARDYVHFGHGAHECFGRHINHATLHLMLKPLLAQPRLRRARGPAGRLRKRGAFAEALTVEFG